MSFNQNLKHNPLKSREDFVSALKQLVDPVYQMMAEQQTPGRVHLADSGSVYDGNRRDIEGFLRTLWGIGPLCATIKTAKENDKLFVAANEGILVGTDPTHPLYWGELTDYDQLFVEMGALATYLNLTIASFWNTLEDEQKKQIYQWLNQINQHTIPQTNWLFFRILVNIFLQKVGYPYPQKLLTEDLAAIDSYYLGEGWYFDGYENQIDYYIPFALAYYPLLYTKLISQPDEHCKSYRERGGLFAKTFQEWFDEKGRALPFGRSQTYRFAQSAFWAAAIYSEIPLQGPTLSQAKYLLHQNMRYWFQQPIFSAAGFLTIGYAYPNLVMAEGYNAPGSPYWALKNFIVLALPEDHPYWQVSEEKPQLTKQMINPYSRMLMIHGNSELQAFTAGQHSHEHAHGASKYEKFVYSTNFGFSVAKDNVLAKQGAFDNTLAVAEGQTHFRTAFGYEDYAIHHDYVYSHWRPWADVSIKNFIIPSYPWHFRVHWIENQRPLTIIDGGFSAPADGKQIPSTMLNSIFYQSSVGTIGACVLQGTLHPELMQPEPNTNLLYNKTELPVITGELPPGKYLFITAYLGTEERQYTLPNTLSATLQDNVFSFSIGDHKGKIKLIEL